MIFLKDLNRARKLYFRAVRSQSIARWTTLAIFLIGGNSDIVTHVASVRLIWTLVLLCSIFAYLIFSFFVNSEKRKLNDILDDVHFYLKDEHKQV